MWFVELILKLISMSKEPHETVRPPSAVHTWPQGEAAVLEFYGNPLSFPTPQNYWSTVGEFARVNRSAFAHVPFLAKHGGFWCHRKCRESLESIFRAIVLGGHATKIRSFDGCYNHRPIRGGSKLSMHSFGAAIDINAQLLPLGSSATVDPAIKRIFLDHGWEYGGDWTGRKDPMHFSAGNC